MNCYDRIRELATISIGRACLFGLLAILGGVPGVLVGGRVADRWAPKVQGGRLALPALFLALLVPQLTSRRAVVAAVLGATIALALTPFTPAGVPIIAASAACLLGLHASPDPEPSS